MEAYGLLSNVQFEIFYLNCNAICEMALHSVFKFTFYITILAMLGAKLK